MTPPKLNAMVGPGNKPSQPWITRHGVRQRRQTMYFSFDTPVDLNPPPVGPDPSGGPTYCGRAVFSDLHVRRRSLTATPRPRLRDVDLSPQEKALEFMLFDLSSCVIPDTMAPPTGVPGPVQ